MKIAVFDIDGTLYCANTTFGFMEYFFSQNKCFSIFKQIYNFLPVQFLNVIIYKLFKIDVVRKILLLFLKGKTKLEIKNAAIYYVEKILNKQTITSSIKILEKLKKEYEIILISGTYDFLCETIATYFKIHIYYASTLEVKNERFTGKYDNDILLNKKDILLKENGEFDDLVVVSDNKSDLDIFQLAERSYIPSKPKHKKFWLGQNLKNMEFLDIT